MTLGRKGSDTMIKFGTGGWRAIIADGFTKENIRLLTAGLCNLMLREGHGGSEICLGYDRRFLSKESMFWAAEVLAGYGMTETANLTTANANVKERPTSIGKLYPGQEAKIVDGELWVKGDNLFSGYYKDEANTKATLTEDGWIKTGDLAKVDEDGFYYIVGRIKNLIILSNGENVSPETIEELFYKNPLVRDCLVSEGDNNGTPCIAIDILPQMAAFEGKEWDEVVATMQGIVDEINKTLPTYEQVAKVSVRKEDFKRTGSLKVARNQN